MKPGGLATPGPGWASWAVYLGVSWTWVIGMFLPVLLLRDHGWIGFAVFLLPNVLGAAAMGFVLDPRGSEGLVRRHRPAMAAFSLVTILLHGLLLGWLLSMASWRLGLIAIASFAMAFAGVDRARSVAAGGVVLAASVVLAGVYGWARGAVDIPSGTMGAGGALWLAPVACFGFALCPYIDLTFHRALASCPDRAAARRAFAAGFGAVFLGLMVFTLLYANTFVFHLAGRAEGTAAPIAAGVIESALFAYVFAQAGITCAMHRAELGVVGVRSGPVLGTLGAGLIAGYAADAALRSAVPSAWGMAPGEVAYRVVLGAYALVFPAYVWLGMIPDGSGRSGLLGPSDRRARLVWCAAVGMAVPLFFAGGIVRGRFEPLLGVVPLLPLLARLALGGGWGSMRAAEPGGESGAGGPPRTG